MNIKFNINYVSAKYGVGSVHDTEYNGAVKVLGKNGDKYVVEFFNTGYVTSVFPSAIKIGNIGDPFMPSVFGVGYMGAKKGSGYSAKVNGKMTKAYDTWFSMMRRCYSDRSMDSYAKLTSYDGVSVCSRWHNFQVFCQDMKNLSGYEDYLTKPMHLDKDVLGCGKEYSPEKCCFLTPTDNCKEMWSRKHTVDFSLVSPTGEVHLFRNASDFAKKHNLLQQHVSKVLNKVRPSHKGWTLPQ